jgi:hypothetical protein
MREKNELPNNRYRTLVCGGMELVEVFSCFETPLSRCDRLSVSGISFRGTLLLDICTWKQRNIKIETRCPSHVKISWKIKKKWERELSLYLCNVVFVSYFSRRASSPIELK